VVRSYSSGCSGDSRSSQRKPVNNCVGSRGFAGNRFSIGSIIFGWPGECATGSLRICESGPDVEVYSPEPIERTGRAFRRNEYSRYVRGWTTKGLYGFRWRVAMRVLRVQTIKRTL